MKAIGYKKAGAIDRDGALVSFEADKPELKPHDLLVEVKGISVNPVDTKVRKGKEPENGPKIIGYDAAGIVRETGSKVTRFKVGDEVFYAGDITRPGTNAEFHAVDERVTGKKPSSMDFAEAAGMPLTSITAWEILFDSFGLEEGAGEGKALLVIGGAGGVGSILIQLAKKLTKLKVIASASRQETEEWAKKMGADHVVNHSNSLAEEMKALDIQPEYVAALTHTDKHFKDIIELIKPRGKVAIIDDPESLDIKPGKGKAISFNWELMFVRPMHQTEDMAVQHELLNRVSEMLDKGTLTSTVTNNLGKMSVETLTEAHKQQESGKMIGKNVLSV